MREGRKNALAGRLEQSGHGLNIARIVWRELKWQARKTECPRAANFANVNRAEWMDFKDAATNATDYNNLIDFWFHRI